MARGKKRIGVGARCSVLIKRLHPQNLITQYHQNYSANERLHDVVVVRQSSITRRGNEFIAIFVSHPSFEGCDAIYVAKRFCVVKHEGNPDGFFDNDHVQETVAMDDDGNFVPEIDPQVFSATNRAEDIALVRNQGYDVDDDNEPAPENVPDATALLHSTMQGYLKASAGVSITMSIQWNFMVPRELQTLLGSIHQDLPPCPSF